MGVRKIVVAGMRPIRCTPFFRSISIPVSRAYVRSYYANNVARGFNKPATKMINELIQDIPRLIVVHENTFCQKINYSIRVAQP